MRLWTTWAILRKDLKRAPRSGIVAFTFVYPILLTAIVQVVFGHIFDPPPRIGIVDQGQSAVAASIRASRAATIRDYRETDTLWRDVRRGDLDLGLAFGADFDRQARAGQKAELIFHTSTSSSAQVLLKAQAVVGKAFVTLRPKPPITVQRVHLSTVEPKSWTDRLLPLLVLLTFFMAGTFLTAFALVDEKLRGTMRAILTTPASMLELLLAKASFSYGIALACALLTLALNGALGTLSIALGVALTIAAVMTIEFGIVLGLLAKDINALYGSIKAMGPFVVLSTLPFIWPAFPTWIAKSLPTWYVIAPLVAIVRDDAPLSNVAADLTIAAAICVALVGILYLVAQRTMSHLDAGPVSSHAR